MKARLRFLVDHHGAGLLTGEVGAGKSAPARTFSAGLNPNLYKVLYPRRGPSAERTQGLNHFVVAAREASAEVIVLDPLYSGL